MTVNVSVHQLAERHLPGRGARRARGVRTAAEALCVELTETALMAAGDGSLDVLAAVKALGVSSALDARRSR